MAQKHRLRHIKLFLWRNVVCAENRVNYRGDNGEWTRLLCDRRLT